MSLPVSAIIGDWVWINDHKGTFQAKPLTVLRNGHKIQGLNEDYIIDVNNINNVLVYKGASFGWAIK